ncbi:MAG TPA: Rad52/Rad22 family DNA repair protein [Anaerolineae bacterium]|nr:Rad52/Rad22 family DNA repair protein [Anaerolineae bacterium]
MADMKPDIEYLLTKAVPPEFVSERQGLSYVTGAYVKRKLNELFGWDGWGYDIDEFRHATPENPRSHCRLALRVYLEADDDDGYRAVICRAGVAQGYGSVTDRQGNPISDDRLNQVLDFADAEAVTDALKRAAVSLGEALGLSLYPMVAGNQSSGKAKSARPKSTNKSGMKKAEF